jgi:hypothetical protein
LKRKKVVINKMYDGHGGSITASANDVILSQEALRLDSWDVRRKTLDCRLDEATFFFSALSVHVADVRHTLS